MIHNIDILINEIKNDPLVRGYATMTNGEILTSLRTKNIIQYKSIGSAELLAWSAQGGRYKKLLSATQTIGDIQGLNTPTSNTIKNICETALLLIRRDGTSLDFNLSDRNQLVDTLVSAGILSADDKNALLLLASSPISRAEQLEINNVNFTDEDITFARSK